MLTIRDVLRLRVHGGPVAQVLGWPLLAAFKAAAVGLWAVAVGLTWLYEGLADVFAAVLEHGG